MHNFSKRTSEIWFRTHYDIYEFLRSCFCKLRNWALTDFQRSTQANTSHLQAADKPMDTGYDTHASKSLIIWWRGLDGAGRSKWPSQSTFITFSPQLAVGLAVGIYGFLLWWEGVDQKFSKDKLNTLFVILKRIRPLVLTASLLGFFQKCWNIKKVDLMEVFLSSFLSMAAFAKETIPHSFS